MKIRKLFTVLLSACIVLSGSNFTMIEGQAKETELSEDGGIKENSWRYREGEVVYNENQSKAKSVYNDAWELVDGNYMNSAGGVIENAVLKGIDVSYYQGEIDWEQVKADGIDFAIIRCGYGDDETNQDDKKWEYNVSECERLGIPYGVYLYSYATTTSMAISEANHVLRLLEGHNPTFPVYLDMEDDTQIVVGREMLAEIAKTFCDTVAEAGYNVGIYASYWWWRDYLTDDVFENPHWSKWVAQYNSECTYKGSYDMWQCTGSGSVEGISGNVDINFWFGSTPFIDVDESEWFYESVKYVYDNDLMNGMSKVIFDPTNTLTRAQFATIIYRMAGSPQGEYVNTFDDVEVGRWYTQGVLWGKENEIIKGITENVFGVNDKITREQMATLLYRYAQASGYELNHMADINGFDDAWKVGNFAKEAVQWAVGNEIIKGVNANTLDPKGNATRAQCATIIMRFIELYK